MGELIESGLTITAIGMGVVFVLLGALVGIIQGMSALAAVLEPARAKTATQPASPAHTHTDDDMLPVIAAAIAAYRRRHRR